MRTILELGGLADPGHAVAAAAYAYAPALRLAVQQSPDGTWGRRMLTVPAAGDATFAGVGTVPAVRRLLEYGWDPDALPFHAARKALFRLLAEDADPAFLYELREEGGDDEGAQRRGRATLREGAAAALAHLGCEADPRLRGAASRLLERVSAYVRATSTDPPDAGPSGMKPVVGAAPPSVHFLVMLAHMPRFRSEHHDEMERLLVFLAAPPAAPTGRQSAAAKREAALLAVVGDPLGDASTAARSLPATLAWLELLARLGFLRRSPSWSALLDQLLVGRDLDGVWRGRADAKAAPTRAWDWPTFPLGDPASTEGWAADVTFRLALIARLAGRRLELV
ncbi:MAG: hypothetical protein JO180_11915 [Gemmatirosa sp.]|nr:hypothetical protein [Gemmatirosa sp.]